MSTLRSRARVVGMTARTAPAGPCPRSAAGRLRRDRPGAPGRRASPRRPSADPRTPTPSAAPPRSPSRNRRQAVNNSSRSAPEVASIPSSGSSRCRNQARSSPSGNTASSFSCGDRGRVGFEDAGVGLQDLPQRPERDPLPIRQTPALPPGRELRPPIDIGEQAPPPAATSPTPAPPPPSPTARNSTPLSCRRRPSGAPGRSRGRRTAMSCVRVRSVPNRARAAFAWNTLTGSAFPFSVAGSNSS